MPKAPLGSIGSFALLLLLATPVAAQHGIEQVDPAPVDGAISTPLPERQRRTLRKYDLPELAGARQALGSQLIDGRLPKPLADFVSREGTVEQRISLFEGGLVVVRMTGAGTIFKKVIIPPDALASYVKTLSPDALNTIRPLDVRAPEIDRRATLRIYSDDGSYVEKVFHPSGILPKRLSDQVVPLQDLLRTISEDRTVTTTVAGYEPKPGDELVSDDQRTYRVVRIVDPPGVVELKCLDDPLSIFIAKKDLSQYFIGRKAK
jgi:hypothetical protein